MTITEIRTQIAKYTELGFSTSEAFSFLRDSFRERRQKSGHKLAEIIGNSEERGTYSIMDKRFIK